MKQPKFSELATSSNQNRKSFLIRFWRENGEENWRVTVESASTGKKHHFKTIETFAESIQQLLDSNNSN